MRNKHHAIHNRVDWTARKESEFIREHPSLIFPMEVPLHNELHRHTTPVPALGIYALQRVVRIWEPDTDKLQSLGNLQRSIEIAGQHPKAHPIERQLGDLAVQAIELQRPYLRESLGLRRLWVV